MDRYSISLLMICSLMLGLFIGCSTNQKMPRFKNVYILGKQYYLADPEAPGTLHDCVGDQVKLFADLCAESSVGYEDMDGVDAFFEGVKCAVEGIQLCEGGL